MKKYEYRLLTNGRFERVVEKYSHMAGSVFGKVVKVAANLTGLSPIRKVSEAFEETNDWYRERIELREQVVENISDRKTIQQIDLDRLKRLALNDGVKTEDILNFLDENEVSAEYKAKAMEMLNSLEA